MLPTRIPLFIRYGLLGMAIAVILLWLALPTLENQLLVSLLMSGVVMIGGYYFIRGICRHAD